MRQILGGCWKCWLTFVLVVLVSAAAVVVAGIVPVSASTGHWPWTAWMLKFAMERSITTHSLMIESPPLDNPALIRRGAGHFDLGCAWCHGSPGRPPSRITMSMTPHAPDLGEQLHHWNAAQLHRIVGHGVMFTAMPAWPDAHRRDEAWAVVAFLKQYSNLDASEYVELAGRNEVRAARMAYAMSKINPDNANPIPEVVVERCVACHGRDGLGRDAYPRLAAQSEQYLYASMLAYRSANRHSGIMGPIAGQLSDDEIAAAARYFARLPGLKEPQDSVVLEERQQAGKLIANQGSAKQKLAACNSCHGQASVRYGHDRLRHYPDLNGQRADYLVQQLLLFRSGDRGGTEYYSIMHKVADSLTDEQIGELARYYDSLARP